MGAIPAGDLSQLPRKTLQDLAKEHGLKANAKSQALAEQLQALRDGKMKGAGAAAAAPKAPAVVASPAKPVDPTRKRLSSLFATVSGPSSMSPMDAVTGSVSRKRARDEDGADDDTIDENAPLMSPLEPARRQSKIMKLASAAGAAGEAWCDAISAKKRHLLQEKRLLALHSLARPLLAAGDDGSAGRWMSSGRCGRSSSPHRAACRCCGLGAGTTSVSQTRTLPPEASSRISSTPKRLELSEPLCSRQVLPVLPARLLGRAGLTLPPQLPASPSPRAHSARSRERCRCAFKLRHA